MLRGSGSVGAVCIFVLSVLEPFACDGVASCAVCPSFSTLAPQAPCEPRRLWQEMWDPGPCCRTTFATTSICIACKQKQHVLNAKLGKACSTVLKTGKGRISTLLNFSNWTCSNTHCQAFRKHRLKHNDVQFTVHPPTWPWKR